MALYRLIIPQTVFKQIEKLDRRQRERVKKALMELADNPYPEGKRWKQLKGLDGEFLRLRVGDWRLMCALEQDSIQILGFVHRRDLEKWIRRR